MSKYETWANAFERVTLLEDGDEAEIDAESNYNINTSFPNYEIFWKRHVVPKTNRPANINERSNVAPEVSKISQLSHAILCDLVDSHSFLNRGMIDDVPESSVRNCLHSIKSSGDAVQKFTDFQDAIVQPRGHLTAYALSTLWSASPAPSH